jgi:hypothetical protein
MSNGEHNVSDHCQIFDAIKSFDLFRISNMKNRPINIL